MSYITTNTIKNSTIMFLFSEKDQIKLDPPYQRMGGIWTKEKKQLLIDSIINDYDLPKLYFHAYSQKEILVKKKTYAVIDGRQRLETIWEFIEGKFNLSEDFEYQKDSNIKLAGLSYNDISKEYLKIKIRFDSFVLPIIGVETDDIDLIEEMFSRLNEAVPLNAAEKRNAIGGNFVQAIRDIAAHDFFQKKVSFSNKRYQYGEVSARFLLLEDSIYFSKLKDTKKVFLDSLAKKYKNENNEIVHQFKNHVIHILELMASIFSEKDTLLRSQGNMTTYYLLFCLAEKGNQLDLLSRRKFLDFNKHLKENRILAKDNYENSSFEFLEYDRLTQQGTNDASNIKARVLTLAKYMELDNMEVEVLFENT